ncbi:MAG: S-layer homology domain-containing protein, partial [Oscillospiraceae bacterium]|nr:S-layer homology domain-containing protein [Oscillospiraceae bacterium]
KKVYVVSERNHVNKYLEAEWDEETESFRASGYFDPDNRSYVPGTISVQFQKQGKGMSFTQEIDYANDPAYTNTVDPIFQPAIQNPDQYLTVTQTQEGTGNRISGELELPTLEGDLETLGIQFDLFTNDLPGWLNPQNVTSEGYQAVENDAGEQLYMRIAEDADGKIQGEIVDFAHEKIVEFLFDRGYYGTEMFVENAFAFSEALSTANKLIKWDNNRVNINVLEESILNSKMSDSEKQSAMKTVESARALNNSLIAIAGLTVVLAAAGITLSFPVSLILPALAWKNSHELDSILSRFGMADASESSGVGMNFRWKIDPSGYVYEAVTSNRLQGVKATAYYQDENGNAVLWDAEEWDQKNPVYTDAEGRYAWDVPEGMWQVKYEMEGYETQYSEWLPVVPPQTDVNIMMTSLAVPKVISAEIDPAYVKIQFSKYMIPETITSSTLKITDENGVELPYDLICSTEETAPDGTVYAKEFTLQFNGSTAVPEKEYKLTTTSAVLSYAGVGCEKKTIPIQWEGTQPVVPEINSLVGTSGKITVQWSEVAGATSYQLQRKIGDNGWKVLSASLENTAYADTDVLMGTTYAYRAAAYFGNALGDFSDEAGILFNPFTDVDPVASPKTFEYISWAYNNGVVTGTSDTTFSPSDNCTKVQFVMMLWKMHGQPIVQGTNPFSDISGKKTTNAILWALDKGIINSGKRFNPDSSISRVQIVMILWKLSGSPKADGANPFTDVSGAKTINAVLWAYNNGITKGTSKTTFAPDANCTRAQLVTFLYKYNNIYHVI